MYGHTIRTLPCHCPAMFFKQGSIDPIPFCLTIFFCCRRMYVILSLSLSVSCPPLFLLIPKAQLQLVPFQSSLESMYTLELYKVCYPMLKLWRVFLVHYTAFLLVPNGWSGWKSTAKLKLEINGKTNAETPCFRFNSCFSCNKATSSLL